MWAPLYSPDFIEHYTVYGNHDWSPMTRVLGGLASRPYAHHLFAFTSLNNFVITTAPSYQEHDPGHLDIAGLAFTPESRQFEVRYGELRGRRWTRMRHCEEFEVTPLIDCVVLAWDLSARLG